MCVHVGSKYNFGVVEYYHKNGWLKADSYDPERFVRNVDWPKDEYLTGDRENGFHVNSFATGQVIRDLPIEETYAGKWEIVFEPTAVAA